MVWICLGLIGVLVQWSVPAAWFCDSRVGEEVYDRNQELRRTGGDGVQVSYEVARVLSEYRAHHRKCVSAIRSVALRALLAPIANILLAWVLLVDSFSHEMLWRPQGIVIALMIIVPTQMLRNRLLQYPWGHKKVATFFHRWVASVSSFEDQLGDDQLTRLEANALQTGAFDRRTWFLSCRQVMRTAILEETRILALMSEHYWVLELCWGAACACVILLPELGSITG